MKLLIPPDTTVDCFVIEPVINSLSVAPICEFTVIRLPRRSWKFLKFLSMFVGIIPTP